MKREGDVGNPSKVFIFVIIKGPKSAIPLFLLTYTVYVFWYFISHRACVKIDHHETAKGNQTDNTTAMQ